MEPHRLLDILADNLRRWAEAIGKEKDFDGQLEKLKFAYQAAQKAVELGGDYKASITLREVSLDLGLRLGLDTGRECVELQAASPARGAGENGIDMGAYPQSSASASLAAPITCVSFHNSTCTMVSHPSKADILRNVPAWPLVGLWMISQSVPALVIDVPLNRPVAMRQR